MLIESDAPREEHASGKAPEKRPAGSVMPRGEARYPSPSTELSRACSPLKFLFLILRSPLSQRIVTQLLIFCFNAYHSS